MMSSSALRGKSVTARVVQGPTEASMDLGGSMDMEFSDDGRRDTAEALRERIAVRTLTQFSYRKT